MSKKGKKEKIDFAVGGQAVIEGVMMRSPNFIAIAVRKPSKKIKIKSYPYKTLTQRYKALNIPIIRGVINLFEMMYVGTKAINYSANESVEENPTPQHKKSTPLKVFETFMFVFSFILALALAIFLFKYLPLLTASFLETKSTQIEQNYLLFNAIDGITKLMIFLAYIFLLSLIPSFRRVFQYHGAEHKSIFTYEKEKPLKPQFAKLQSRFHPRCGTSFIIIVFLISIIVYTFIPKQDSFTLNLSYRIAFLPLIAGLAYEALKLSAKYCKNIIVRALTLPGLWTQRITTKEPTESQLEVGLCALEKVLELEK